MSRWRWLVSVPTSLLLHGVGLALILSFFSRETTPPAILVTLGDMVIASGKTGPSVRKETPAKAVSAPSRRPARRAAVASASREASSPASLAQVLDALRAVASASGEASRRTGPPSVVNPVPTDRAGPASPPEPREERLAPELSDADVAAHTPGVEGGREEPVTETNGSAVELVGVPASDGEGGDSMRPLLRPPDQAEGRSGGVLSEGLALAARGSGQTDFDSSYGPYLERLRQKIQEALQYPPMARRRGLTGTVQMEIVILVTGAISQVSLLGSSSHPILDQAAVEAVRSLSPLPFPTELPPRTLRVRLPVVFELR